MRFVAWDALSVARIPTVAWDLPHLSLADLLHLWLTHALPVACTLAFATCVTHLCDLYVTAATATSTYATTATITTTYYLRVAL